MGHYPKCAASFVHTPVQIHPIPIFSRRLPGPFLEHFIEIIGFPEAACCCDLLQRMIGLLQQLHRPSKPKRPEHLNGGHAIDLLESAIEVAGMKKEQAGQLLASQLLAQIVFHVADDKTEAIPFR